MTSNCPVTAGKAPHLRDAEPRPARRRASNDREALPPIPKAKRSEAVVLRAILAYLRTIPGVVAWRNNTGAVKWEHKGVGRFIRFGEPGMSDILGWRSVCMCCDGYPCRVGPLPGYVARFLALEVKSPQWRPPKSGPAALRWSMQQAFLAKVTQAGGLGFMATSVEDVVKAMQR